MAAPNVDAILKTIRTRESGGDYGIINQGGGTASGAYQYVDKTWRAKLNEAGLGNLVAKYPRAYMAPANIQDTVARHDVMSTLNKNGGDVSKIPVSWYYPAALTNPALLDTVPGKKYGNKQTIRSYANDWLKAYNKIAGSSSQVWGGLKGIANQGVAAVENAGAGILGGQGQMTMNGLQAMPTPQINILDVLAQAMGLVQQTQPQQVDLSSYVQQVAADRHSQLTDELATIDAMQQQAMDRIRQQYAVSQQGLVSAGRSAASDLGAIAGMNTPPGQVSDVASQMAALGYGPGAADAAVARVSPDVATLMGQQQATGQFLGGIAAGTQQGIADTQGQMLAAMQAASLGDVQAAGLVQQLKARQASTAAQNDFSQRMQELAAQANIQADQSRVPQLLQAINAIGQLQQGNAQLALTGQGQMLDAQQNNIANALKGMQFQSDQQANAKQLLLQQQNSVVDNAYKQAQIDAMKNPQKNLSPAEVKRLQAIEAAAVPNRTAINNYVQSAFSKQVKQAGSVRKVLFNSKNEVDRGLIKKNLENGSLTTSGVDSVLVAFAAEGDRNGAKQWLTAYFESLPEYKNAGKGGTSASKANAKTKFVNDNLSQGLAVYDRLRGAGRLTMTAEDYKNYSDSFIN